jgi:23S rRNA (uracil1939-C5)-methyltransferase
MAKRIKRGRSFDEAVTLEVLQASPSRVEPGCAHYGRCAGCVLQHLVHPEQLTAKQRVLAENLQRLGQVTPEQWLAPLPSAPWGYRRRARLSVRYVAKKGRTLVGFREVHGAFVADIDSCPVLDTRLNALLLPLSDCINALTIRAAVPQVEVSAGDAQLALLLRHLQPLTDTDADTLSAFAQDRGVALYLQSGGPATVTWFAGAEPGLRYALPEQEVDFEFEPADFIQVNAGLNQAMVAQALDQLQPKAGEAILDLYCGLGNFSLPIARRGARVVGVEGSPELVSRARSNAQRQGLSVEFHAADLSVDAGAAAWAQEHWDKILLDPPRAGAAAVFEYLPGASVQRVVYVSCHPGSLARDAGVLVRKHGFKLSAAGVMDMFPHTAHVESMAVFDRM